MKHFRVQQVAQILGTSVDTVRKTADESGIKVTRQANGPQTRIFTMQQVFELARFRVKANRVSFREERRKPIVVSVYAAKGGVGKTTISANLAVQWAATGLRVLVIDADFQGNLTELFGYNTELTEDDIDTDDPEEREILLNQMVRGHLGTVFNWVESAKKSRSSKLESILKKPFGNDGPHVLPADLTLDGLDSVLGVLGFQGKNPTRVFAKFFADGKEGEISQFNISEYDVIIVDCAPAKNRITRSILLASDFVVSPCSLERFSTKAISYLSGVLKEIREEFGINPELLVVGNFFDGTRLRTLRQLKLIEEAYGKAWVEASVRASEEFRRGLDEAPGVPLCIAKPGSDVAGELRHLARTLLVRMGVVSHG